jgi:hypothetical protein
MLLRVTNKGPARIVDFLAAFGEDETKEFDQQALEHYQNQSGVPIFSSILTDEDQFDVLVVDDKKEEGDN